MDAMVDLTGGLAESYEIEEETRADNKLKDKLYKYVLNASEDGAFITTSIEVSFLQHHYLVLTKSTVYNKN